MSRRNDAQRARDAAQHRIKRQRVRAGRLGMDTPKDVHAHPTSRFGTPPPKRELEAIAEISIHGTGRRAAYCMGISSQTLKNHVSSLHARIGSGSVPQALMFLGWITIPKHVGTAFHEQETE
jgi:DNA-binding CsgD family transcriptional regulator